MSGRGRKKLAAGLIVLAVTVTAAVAGCRQQNRKNAVKEPYTIGFVTKSKSSEYWMSVCSGAEKAAKDLGVSVMIVSPNTETDDKLQRKMIGDLINKGVDALAISPIQSYEAEDYLDKAEGQNIPVYSYDTKIVSQGIPYIGIDNTKAGREIAQYMAEQIGQTGQVGIITGGLEQAAHRDRTEGFRKYIEENTDIEIVFTESGYSNLQMSEKEISRLMQEHPDVDGIFATSAVTALGIMEYMSSRPVVIATVDAQQDAIEAVRDGRIMALVAQSGYDIGYKTIEYIVNDRDGASQSMEEILDVEILTKDNADQYDGSR